MKPTLTIEANIPENLFIESCLNMRYSNVSNNYLYLLLSLYAFVNKLHIDELSYYLNLLEIK